MIGSLILCATLAAIDGDSIRCNGINMRDMGDGAPFVSGYDTPETYGPKCDAERRLGERATERMDQLLGQGAAVYDSGEADQYGRPLVSARMPDGRSIGSILMAEGLAREWTPAYVANWCGA
jgi:micrococcal nuclease